MYLVLRPLEDLRGCLPDILDGYRLMGRRGCLWKELRDHLPNILGDYLSGDLLQQ